MVGRIFLGRYEAIRLLGEGGMGRVYLARQTDLGRQVVVKVMHDHIAADPKFRERFQRETLLMARFQHPYAVTLYDASLNDPQGPCIVMEYIRGVTLDTLLQRNGRLNPRARRPAAGQLCEVLQAAHAEGIIHRDLKPANLMVVDPDTPYEMLKVMDFGLAKLLEAAQAMRSTRSRDTNAEFAVGTPGYMCPEQARGEEMDHRGDLYCVGVILFELLTGRLPFAGATTRWTCCWPTPPSRRRVRGLGRLGLGAAGDRGGRHACLAKNPERPAAQRPRPGRAFRDRPGRVERRGNAPGRQSRPRTGARSGRPTADLAPPSRIRPGRGRAPHGGVDARHDRHLKLRGFVHDFEGEVVESVPGMIRVSPGRGRRHASNGAVPGSASARTPWWTWSCGWSGINPTQQNVLHITVIMTPRTKTASNPEWLHRCMQIFCELRGYLAGSNVG